MPTLLDNSSLTLESLIFIRSFSTKKGNKYIFRNVKYTISTEYVVKEIRPYFERFISENKQLANTYNYVSVICQIRDVGNSYYTLGDRYPIDLTNEIDLSNYIDYVQSKWFMLDNNRYNPQTALSIIFNFTTTDQNDYICKVNKIRMITKKSELSLDFDFGDDLPLNIPANTEYSTWGKSIERLKSNILRVIDLTIDSGSSINRYLDVKIVDKFNRIVEIYSSSSKLLLTKFTVKIIDELRGSFIRQIGDKFYHIRNNKVYFFFEQLFPTKFIERLKPHNKYNFDIMTLDIETFDDENKIKQIYCICIFDGKETKSFYLTDYFNIDSLIKDLLRTIFSKKYSGKHIYIHNSSEFDMIFLYKYIVNYGSCQIKPVIKDGKFISLDVWFGKDHIQRVSFKDSILLLNSSLAKLSKTFNINHTKDCFPHKFVTPNNLNYVGIVPGATFFDKLTSDEYNAYVSRFGINNWSLKIEAIKYCEIDCKALYEVLSNFSKSFFNKFRINITKTPTLPSAAFKTYRTSFIPKDVKLPAIDGKLYDDIHNAFYGGHVDMYIPTNPEGTKVFGYDVNSLYPYVMRDNKYPVNFIGYFRGDIINMLDYNKLYKNSLGILKVKVKSPDNILHPVLPKKVGNTTVYGVGTWEGWYFSEELNNALKYGYTFQVLGGYLFDGVNIFKEYIDTLYQMKASAAKDSPEYSIAKMLQNSLFGKFCMARELVHYAVVKPRQVNDFIKSIGFDNLINKVDIGNVSIISYKIQYQNPLNINIAIGSAITAYARIHMSQFKNNPNIKLYYSDTGSVFTENPLPDYLIDDKKLGLLKLEHVLSKFVGLGPKVYGGIDSNGNEFVKTKGLKTKLSLRDLEDLLIENQNKDFNQEKWFNNLIDGHISVTDSKYNLKPTNYKRQLVYSNGMLVGTANKDVSD